MKSSTIYCGVTNETTINHTGLYGRHGTFVGLSCEIRDERQEEWRRTLGNIFSDDHSHTENTAVSAIIGVVNKRIPRSSLFCTQHYYLRRPDVDVVVEEGVTQNLTLLFYDDRVQTICRCVLITPPVHGWLLTAAMPSHKSGSTTGITLVQKLVDAPG
ncbi:hypothetical protein KIN20_010216 [Parelaphostrongylus tenuis]|uniref:Uncharacterized protein n=1 Tax=Parelaphostrongylus tenuis TaxID=148309 RepID=A0AAD5MSZ7_PARTN|nr:hypothetical protein KIN20_010216 [Parelaphostrongylus tenuis]